MSKRKIDKSFELKTLESNKDIVSKKAEEELLSQKALLTPVAEEITAKKVEKEAIVSDINKLSLEKTMRVLKRFLKVYHYI